MFKSFLFLLSLIFGFALVCVGVDAYIVGRDLADNSSQVRGLVSLVSGFLVFVLSV